MPTDLNLLKSQMEVDIKLKLAKFELTDQKLLRSIRCCF
jgi:hypothetical protein